MNTLAKLTISGTSIRQDTQGRYCLNDLHKAAGGESKHQPGKWQITQQATEFIEYLKSEQSITGIPVIFTKQGHGTYAVKEIVYAYAMWISAKFHICVIRAYDDLATGKIQQAPPIDLDRLSTLISERMTYKIHAGGMELFIDELRKNNYLVAEMTKNGVADMVMKYIPIQLVPFLKDYAIKRLESRGRVPEAIDNLLPPEQQQEIYANLDRLMAMFHPLSQSFSDLLSISRVLQGLDSSSGMKNDAYKQVLDLYSNRKAH